jgi:3-oxoacyl-[acyl-carrier-protein] synthase II
MGCAGAGGMGIEELFATFRDRKRNLADVNIEELIRTKTARCEEPDWKKYVPLKFIRRTDEITKYTMAAGREAMNSAKLTVTKANMDRIGVLYGTATGPMETIEGISRAFITRGIAAVDPSAFPNTVLNQAPGNFSIAYMLKGPTSTVALSGTAEIVAFQYACELLNNGQADAIVVIGADEANDPLFAGYGKAGLLTKDGKPAHAEGADGMTLSKGAAAFILEKESSARERGARILATVLACSCASDNCRLSETEADGSGLKHCVTEGIRKAAIEAPDLYVCSAPGVAAVDRMEAKVIRELFDGETALANPQALVGTTLGAAGGYGILSALYAFEKGEVCGMPDGGYETGGELGDRLPKENRAKDVKTAFVSSIGFGGAYAGVVLGKGEYEQ